MRDYDLENQDTNEHKYGYTFDFDVIHPYTIKSFVPFFVKGSVLELGSYQGKFTKRLLEHFPKVDCIEASNDAAKIAKKLLGNSINVVVSTFEDAKIFTKWNNVVLTHVLEHLDDPILILKKIKQEWLLPGGRVFITCPNANAISRQIAVDMGLISQATAITDAEAKHGHRITYTIETLSRDVIQSGLRIIHKSGILFKAFANFQWDKLLNTDVISDKYIEACYQLGLKYPDLCASIFLVCE